MIIPIVTTEWKWTVLSVSKQDTGGQWVNVFSMALGLAQGKDEAERLTWGPKGQVTPEHHSRLSPNSTGDSEERLFNPHITLHAVESTSC